ncbi:MAG: uracil-DNA glycosylase family protein [Haloarculaceae archaeon]
MRDPAYPDDELATPLADDCRRCPALVEARERIAWGVGPLDAALVVVGEAPGYGNPDAERWRGGNWTGKAYTARHSGRRVRALLADAGFGPAECYFTNAVKCFPAADEPGADGEPTNREPTADERANCRPHLRAEVEQVDPAAVVTTGRHATASVLAADGVELESFLETVLEPVESAALETTVVALLHPSYQDVWIPRLDLETDYAEAVARTLAAIA